MSPQSISETKAKPVTLTVNGSDVTVPDHKVTGAAIKQAAIDAGLPIAGDFVLYVREGKSAQYEPVGDNETVTVHDGETFRAVAPDDVA
jgi:hypothetical protein